MDLCTTTQNRKCHHFCSLQGLGRGVLSDAFLQSWVGDLIYVFLLILLISRVLSKIKRDEVRVVMIALA